MLHENNCLFTTINVGQVWNTSTSIKGHVCLYNVAVSPKMRWQLLKISHNSKYNTSLVLPDLIPRSPVFGIVSYYTDKTHYSISRILYDPNGK